MQCVTIMRCARFRLDSYGNGFGYTFRNLADKRSVWFQGDDAATFREELDSLESARPHDSTDSILGHLWDEYECVSQPD